MLEKPHSERNIAAIAAWDFGNVGEWRAFASIALNSPERFAAEAADIFDLPQLGGCHFARQELLSPTLAPTLDPTEVMRTISARTRNLSADVVGINAISASICDGSVGFVCVAARMAALKSLAIPYITPLPIASPAHRTLRRLARESPFYSGGFASLGRPH